MFIALLGRQPELSIAELSAVFGEAQVTQASRQAALIDTPACDIDQLGGTLKIGRVVATLPLGRDDKTSLLHASRFITDHYTNAWRQREGKMTLGISVYGLKTSSRNVQKIGLLLKNRLKKTGVSLRLVPNDQPTLSTATSHHNKLGRAVNKIELLIVRTPRHLYIAESCGTQNITAYTRRDRQRPRRDAFVGMLPPKLAQMMLNLALGPQGNLPAPATILDPFCGTGTVLQEALLKGYTVIGSDLSQKMVDYTQENLAWLQATHHTTGNILTVTQGDAMSHQWTSPHPIDAVVCETYLGQPFSAPPAPAKLAEVVGNCNHIITHFLTNLHPQLPAHARLCIAVPAWQGVDDTFTHLPLVKQLSRLGYESLNHQPLLYHRDGQVVARQLLILRPIRAAS
ncbi:MAG: methyltransferase domain-containing protein [Candidatus Saccharibacteria bacterium]|nr:methyltransferase domain-containing protein [Candidatus Saccharibacteria bacterium]